MIRDLNYWIRIGSPLVATLAVFLIIQSIISQGSSIDNKSDNPNFVDFIRIKQDDSLQERKRTIPDKPPTPKRPPQPKIE